MMAEGPYPKRRRVDDPYEYDFIDKRSEDFHCPVTLEILTEPHQTLCCGNHLSQEAADRLKREGKPCPMCKKPNLNTMPDKFFKRMVNQLKVRCSKKALGCNWVGELGDLEKHLSEGSVDGQCQYIAVACPLLCGDHIQRHLLEEHKSLCPQRIFVCDYCDYEDTYKNVMKDHWFKCKKRPIECPNKCGENALVRRHLKQHLAITCPLQDIECEFSYAGCDIVCGRQDMQEHLDGNMQSHLTMVSAMTSDLQDTTITLEEMIEKQEERIEEHEQKIEEQEEMIEEHVQKFEEQEEMIEELTGKSNTQEKKIRSLIRQIQTLTSQVQLLTSALKPGALATQQVVPSPVFIPPPDIVMTDFAKHKNDGDSWYSPPFYSHIGGYKLCININANGYKAGAGTHVGVVLHMMRGEYDDNLKWPFKGEIKVQLLDQRGDKGHFEQALLELSHYQESQGFDRVVGCRIAKKGRGNSKFIAHTDLGYNPAEDCQYLMNDCLKFRVTKIELIP